MEGGRINSHCKLEGNLVRRFTADTGEYGSSQIKRLHSSLHHKATTTVWPGRLVTCSAASGSQNQTVAAAANPLSTLSSLSKNVGTKVAAGVVSGTIQAGIFHPWDRALYLSQTNNRRFLDARNWGNPLQGVRQTLAMRIASASVFFPLEDSLTTLFENALGRGKLANVLAGNVAGAVGAAAVNPLQAVRYTCMSLRSSAEYPDKHRFLATAQAMYRAGGYRAFLKGVAPTAMRDLVFGGVFSSVRRELSSRWAAGAEGRAGRPAGRIPDAYARFGFDLVAAVLGTAASSPLNYARNLLYAPASAGGRPGGGLGLALIGDLFATAARQGSPVASLAYLQSRLKLGPATLRVSLSMAIAASAYSYYKDWT